MTKKEESSIEEAYELDITMCKYWWREHRDLANISHIGWSHEMKQRHPDLIKAWQKYKKAELKLERTIKNL